MIYIVQNSFINLLFQDGSMMVYCETSSQLKRSLTIWLLHLVQEYGSWYRIKSTLPHDYVVIQFEAKSRLYKINSRKCENLSLYIDNCYPQETKKYDRDEFCPHSNISCPLYLCTSSGNKSGCLENILSLKSLYLHQRSWNK